MMLLVNSAQIDLGSILFLKFLLLGAMMFKVKFNPERILPPLVCSVYEEGKRGKLHGGGPVIGRMLFN